MAETPDSKKFSIRSRLRSFSFAFHGLSSLLKYEHNSRIHLVAATSAIFAGFLLKIKLYEWILLIIVIGIVFIAELLNSALESLADRITTEPDDIIRRAKDYSAAAVLISAIIALVAGCLIFIPRILPF